MTTWQVAADWVYTEMLQKLSEWAKENKTTDEINNKLLLATDDKVRTYCQMVAKGGKLEVLQ
jgi:hypothetical protein